MAFITKTIAALSFALGLAIAGQALASGQSCGGASNLQCPTGQYCRTPSTACHVPAAKGVCEESPQICNELYEPVCGCDGKTYANACHAAQKGVTILSQGACATPVSPSSPGG